MPTVRFREWKDPETGAKKRSKWLYLDYRDRTGTRVFVRTDPPTANRKIAKEQLNRALVEGPQPGGRVLVEKILDAYMDGLKARSPSTAVSRGSPLRWWKERWGSRTAREIRIADVDAALLELREKKSEGNRFNFIVFVRCAFRRAVAEGLIAWDHPAATFKIPKGTPERHIVWTDAELDRLRQHLVPWARPIIDFVRASGLRIGDALALEWENVLGDKIRVRMQKTRRVIVLPLSEQAQGVLGSLSREGPYVFPGQTTDASCPYHRFWGAVRRAKLAAGITNRTIHDLRRTLATALDNAHVSRQAIALLLGQKNTNMVGRYTHLEQETLRAALETGQKSGSMAEATENQAPKSL